MNQLEGPLRGRLMADDLGCRLWECNIVTLPFPQWTDAILGTTHRGEVSFTPSLWRLWHMLPPSAARLKSRTRPDSSRARLASCLPELLGRDTAGLRQILIRHEAASFEIILAIYVCCLQGFYRALQPIGGKSGTKTSATFSSNATLITRDKCIHYHTQ